MMKLIVKEEDGRNFLFDLGKSCGKAPSTNGEPDLKKSKARPLRGKRFDQSGHLKVHNRQEGEILTNECVQCGKCFAMPGYLKLHMNIHLPEKPFKCSLRGKGYSSKGMLKSHMKDHMSVTEKKGRAGLRSFWQHAKTSADTHWREIFVGLVCGKDFSRADSLHLHQRLHRLDKQFFCSECDKAFYTLGSLTVHERTHTGVKPYPCSVCVRRFNSSTHMKNHMGTHTAVRPYHCSECAKSYITSSALQIHQMKHIHNSTVVVEDLSILKQVYL